MSGFRNARRRAGLTQVDLATRAGVGQNTISRIERGKCPPSVGLLLRLADELSVSTDALLGRTAGPSDGDEEAAR